MTDLYITKQRDKLKLIELLKGTEMPYKVTVKKGGTRSLQQNRYLWGYVYPTIIEQAQLEGWRNDDLHEYWLGECFGWATLEGLDKKRMRPIHRSSTLTKMEFVDYVAFIQEKAASQFGIFIEDPSFD